MKVNVFPISEMAFTVGFVLYAGEITETAKKQQKIPNYVNMDLQKNMNKEIGEILHCSKQ